MAEPDRDALVALYRATGGENWYVSWDTYGDLKTWHGVKVNDQGRVVTLQELSYNSLKGHIPKELGGLSQLQRLRLEDNELTGEIPATLGQLGNLQDLDIFSNRLIGPIPKELGGLSQLQTLDLSRNLLTGEIPATLGQLGNLQSFSIFYNKLSGPIPKELGGLSQLQTLRLSDNKLTGPIPKELGGLSQLQMLDLSCNLLTGEIPATLGQLGNLVELYFEGNKLSGRIPKELANLGRLLFLRLGGNQLSGPIPPELQKHPRFGGFNTGLALDGPPLPTVTGLLHAIKILIVPVVLGYADLASDLYTAVSYYKANDFVWFGLGLIFALGPAVIVSLFFLSSVGWFRRFLLATQLSLLAEAWNTVDENEYSPVLALVRVVEPLFESVPQLLLQLYAMLSNWVETSSSSSRLAWRAVSVCISAASLAYAATDVSSVERLLTCGGGSDSERFRLCPRCPSLTGVVFSRVPAQGTSSLRGFGNVHPRCHVWLCFVYHVLEIVARFIPLAMLVLVVRGWFLLVLVYLWVSRGLIVWMTAREGLWFRFWVRLVAMPFLDSIMDGTTAFGTGLVLTLVEFIVCMVIYHVFKHDDLPSRARLVLVTVASCCMVGKMCLAWVAICPLKVDGDYSESQGDGVLGDGRGSAVTDGSAVDVKMSAIEDGKVEGGAEARAVSEPASPKGADGPSATSTVSTGSVVRGPGDVKVEDETDGVEADGFVEGPDMTRMEDGKIDDGSKDGGSEVLPPEETHLPPATHALSTISTAGDPDDAKVEDDS